MAEYVEVCADGADTWIPCQVKEKTDEGVTFFLLIDGRGYELRTRSLGPDRNLHVDRPDLAPTPGLRIHVRPLMITGEQVEKIRAEVAR